MAPNGSGGATAVGVADQAEEVDAQQQTGMSGRDYKKLAWYFVFSSQYSRVPLSMIVDVPPIRMSCVLRKASLRSRRSKVTPAEAKSALEET